jgi:hypothetical protein
MGTRFNHLQVPDQYNQYFTKYPQGYTILEALINWVQQVNDMTENLNDINIKLDEFLAQFEGELYETVSALIAELQASGEFDAIITSVLYGETIISNYNSFQLAVTDSKAKNSTLNIGAGQTTITGNAPDFHAVLLKGNGSIKRSNNVFYPNPDSTQVNNLYVNVGIGNDNNDGLTPDFPLKTLQKAVDILVHYASPSLKGNWIINLAAGTYPEAVKIKDHLTSENPITIQGADVGGHPTVPTTFITMGTGASAVGILARYGVDLFLKDVKLTGYNGTTSSGGVVVAFGSTLKTSNVHTSGNYWGLSGQHGTLEVPDGIHEGNGWLAAGGGNGAAFRSLMLNKHHIGIQNIGNRSKTAIVRNNLTGLFTQENCTGHVDWCTFIGNTDGLYIGVNSRANADGTLFQDNFRAIRRLMGHAFISGNTSFVNNNANLSGTSGSQLTGEVIDSMDSSYATADTNLKTTYVNQDIKSTTNTPFFTAILKAGFWKSAVNSITPIKKIEFNILGEVINNTGVEGSGTKSMNMRVGGTAAAISIATTEKGTFRYKGTIFFVDETTQYLFLEGNIHNFNNKQSLKKLNLDMSVNQTITLEAQTAQPLDTVHVDVVEFKIAGQ